MHIKSVNGCNGPTGPFYGVWNMFVCWTLSFMFDVLICGANKVMQTARMVSLQQARNEELQFVSPLQ